MASPVTAISNPFAKAIAQRHPPGNELTVVSDWLVGPNVPIDPTRREDPGPVWTTQHATNVLDFCYQAQG